MILSSFNSCLNHWLILFFACVLFTIESQNKYGFKDWDSILAAVGHGALKESQIVNRLNEEHLKTKKAEVTDKDVLEEIVAAESKEKSKKKEGKGGIVVKGIHDVAVRFSKCCNPVPGDEIVGFVTRGRGISIHRTDCVNIINFPANERARLIEAEWEQGQTAGYSMRLKSIYLPITELDLLLIYQGCSQRQRLM